MRRPRQKEPPICRWPHCGMSGYDERRFELLATRLAPFIGRAARRKAQDTSVEPGDLAQEALIWLWRTGLGQAVPRSDAYLRTTLSRRMTDVLLKEWRRWGRGKRSFQPEE